MNLSNNTILITGGGTGIGFALARELIVRENIVIICGRDKKKLERAKHECIDLKTIVCDVSDPESTAKMTQEVIKKYPSLNILINNAGVMHIHDVAKNSLPFEHQETEIMTNFYAVVSLCNKFLPHLQKQKKSAVLNMTSGLAYLPFSAAPVYAATKAGIHSYTQSIRQALQQTNVKVFEALPPIVDTMMSKDFEMDGMDKMSPEQIASIILSKMEKGINEIRPGQANMLIKMYKVFPWLVNKKMREITPKILTKIPQY